MYFTEPYREEYPPTVEGSDQAEQHEGTQCLHRQIQKTENGGQRSFDKGGAKAGATNTKGW